MEWRRGVLDNPNYIKGVQKAQERKAAQEVLSKKRLEDFLWFHKYADRHAAAESRRKVEARRAKYGN